MPGSLSYGEEVILRGNNSNIHHRAGKRAQWAKVLAEKPDTLSLVLGAYIKVDEEKCPLMPTRTLWYVCVSPFNQKILSMTDEWLSKVLYKHTAHSGILSSLKKQGTSQAGNEW